MKYFETFEFPNHYENILIIPLDGCAACLSPALLYIDNDSLWVDAIIIAGHTIQSKSKIGNTDLWYDQEKIISLFPTGIHFPYLIKRKNNYIVEAVELKTNSQEEFKTLINKYSY